MQPPAAPHADPLLVPYLPDCVLLRAVARALALPAPAAAAALAYLHRTRRSGTPWALGREDLVCGCLYVAAKAEEVQLSTNQAINATRLLSLPENRALLEALAPLARALPQPPPADAVGGGGDAAAAQGPSRSSVLVGDAYYAAKQGLYTAEQHVLRHNRFGVAAPQPYKHALHMARTLLASGGGGGGGSGEGGDEPAGDAPAVARLAVALLHDALTATALGVTEAPEALAAASLVAALQLAAPEGAASEAAARGEALVEAAGLRAGGVGRLALQLLGVQTALARLSAGSAGAAGGE